MSKILILSSNPRRDLNLNREISDLTTAIQRLGRFELRFGFEARSQELQGLLAEHRPQIVHFCGHGAGKRGLVFQDEQGQEKLISTELLARIFHNFSDEINCVVLNACDSDRQAKAIVEDIDYVIGMSQPILDQAAYVFSVGFYTGLAAGKSIEKAYNIGCTQIQIWCENNAQSSQSQQYRQFILIEERKRLSVVEYLKPILLKRSDLKGSHLCKSIPIQPDLAQEWVDFLKEEIDRKKYKDQARNAYDHFGKFSAQNQVSLTKEEVKQRKILLNKVKDFWIEGFLKPSCQNSPIIKLDLENRPDAIADLSQGIEALAVELDASYETLQNTRIYEEIGQGRTLLILGSPGAGKTLALLQLAQRLIKRSELKPDLPIPVVFNLSSWAKEQKPMIAWLINELREKYQVSKTLSEPWLRQQQLILLLDELDEVKEEYRNDCVRALNTFMGLFPQTEVAICSRVKDYEVLTERLKISSALGLQPLKPKQVYQFLDKVGGSLSGLKTLLKRETKLEQFAQTPLILNFMSVAYQGWSVQELLPQLYSVSEENCKNNLFNDYIDRRLEQGTIAEYSKDKILRWLSWLASRIVQEKQTIFLIEKMQPTWLNSQTLKKDYLKKLGVMSGLLFGLIFTPTFGLIEEDTNLILILIVTCICGYIVGRTSFLPQMGWTLFFSLSRFQEDMESLILVESLGWSWRKTLPFFFLYSAGILGVVSIIISIYYSSSSSSQHDHIISISGTINLCLTLFILGLIPGITIKEQEKTSFPNQGIWKSGRNAVVFILASLLVPILIIVVIMLIFTLTTNFEVKEIPSIISRISLLILRFLSLFVPFLGLNFGGTTIMKHFALRRTLHQNGFIPWNYAKFLDFASAHLLMKKVGGGYVFFHRMLLEHFAQIWDDAESK